jgi:hypothetical protein
MQHAKEEPMSTRPGRKSSTGSTEHKPLTSSELDDLLERIRGDHAELSRKLAVKEQETAELARRLAAKEHQIAEITRSLGTAVARIEDLQDNQREHDSLATRLREEELAQERDALAARLHAVEQTRYQIMETIARELGTVSLASGGDLRGRGADANGRGPKREAPPSAQLVITGRPPSGLSEGHTFTLRPGITAGRRPGTGIELDDAFMSGDHARLTVDQGRWWVADLGSTNGTFVNGARIDRATPLKEGDEVRFGRIRTRFTVEKSQGAAHDRVLDVPEWTGAGRAESH